ncbi:PREDICTED: RING finger protein vilya [Bactrocera latifrons]|uniref:RING finger protein vilya n=1 Tax=Bactrocera latifrons TaxID=174628 RepID=UPI0008DCC5E3|nr:PREDICTED: RING finger protein vilya [Bactrocera latifrons]
MEGESFDDLNTNSNLKLPKDVGLYWIHCNRCLEIYIRKRRRLFLLSCNHMICEKCATTLAINHINVSSEVHCPICNKTQRYRVLCNVMPAHAKELLNPEPWREPNERILNFQAKQRDSFKKGMFRKRTEMEKVKRKCNALEINSKQKYEKYEQLRYERKQLEREILKIKKFELQPKSKYFQTTEGDISTNGMFNLNTFTGVKRANTNTHPRITGHNVSHTALNKSFSLNIF